MQERAEVARRVEALGAEVAPRFLLEDAAIDLEVPVDLQGLPLGIVVGAGQAHPSGLLGWLLHRLDQPAARAHLDQIADARGAVRKQFGNAIQRYGLLANDLRVVRPLGTDKDPRGIVQQAAVRWPACSDPGVNPT